MDEDFILIHESLDDTIFIDLKISIGNDIKHYDSEGLINNDCDNMKRVECGDIHSVKNISERTSPVYENYDGWFEHKTSRNVEQYDLPFMRESFMLCVYSFLNFKNIYGTAIKESGGNYVTNIKFDIGSIFDSCNDDDHHRIGLINTDGSEIKIGDHIEFVRGLSFFYLKPGVKISISNGNRFCLIGSVVVNLNSRVSPIIGRKKRKYRDISSKAYNDLKNLI